MDRSKMHIGQKVRILSRDIMQWNGDDEGQIGEFKKVGTQTEKILFVRELNNPEVVGVSYSMDTPAENSFSVRYEHILTCTK